MQTVCKSQQINVDWNPFIIVGDFLVEEELIWLPVRMCGKFTDCLMEIGGVYDESVDVFSGVEYHKYATPYVTVPKKIYCF